MYVQLNHLAVNLKHCKSTILQQNIYTKKNIFFKTVLFNVST